MLYQFCKTYAWGFSKFYKYNFLGKYQTKQLPKEWETRLNVSMLIVYYREIFIINSQLPHNFQILGKL